MEVDGALLTGIIVPVASLFFYIGIICYRKNKKKISEATENDDDDDEPRSSLVIHTAIEDNDDQPRLANIVPEPFRECFRHISKSANGQTSNYMLKGMVDRRRAQKWIAVGDDDEDDRDDKESYLPKSEDMPAIGVMLSFFVISCVLTLYA